jgi:hypothetical protein
MKQIWFQIGFVEGSCLKYAVVGYKALGRIVLPVCMVQEHVIRPSWFLDLASSVYCVCVCSLFFV